MSRPKWTGMTSTARAALEARACSADLSAGQETTCNVIDARMASMKSCEAVESSKSCTTIGSSFTVSELAVLISRSSTTGRISASASVRQSRTICVNSFRVCATIRLTRILPSIFRNNLALLACLFNDGNKNIFEREAALSGAEHMQSVFCQAPGSFLDGAGGRFFRDHVQTVAKQRDPPAFGVAFQKIGGALRLVDDEFKQMSGLPALDSAGRAFRYKLPRHHHSQAIALLGFLKIVSGHEDGRAGISQPIDHCPERAPGKGIDAGSRFVQKNNVRFMHDRGPKGYALLPASWEAASDLVLFALEAREGQHPTDFFQALVFRDSVNARKKFQVLANRHVVIQRKFLRHIADALTHAFRSEISRCARHFNFSACRVQQSAKHLDGRCFSGAVGSKQTKNLAITNVEADILDGGKCSKLFDKPCRADGDPSVQAAVVMPRWKFDRFRFPPESAQFGDKRVFESGFVDTNLIDRKAGLPQLIGDHLPVFVRIAHQQVETIAKTLHVDDCFIRAGLLRKQFFRLSEVRGPQFEPLRTETRTQLCGRSDLMNLALIHQRNSMTPFGLVQVRCGNKDREALRRQVRKHVPEFPARHWVDTRGGLIEQQDPRLGNERANERQLLFHSAA